MWIHARDNVTIMVSIFETAMPWGSRKVTGISFPENVRRSLKENMFRKIWWRLRAVRSDEGFAVNFIGLRRGIEYSEDGQVFRLEVERGTGDTDCIVYAKSLKQWLPSGKTESVSDHTTKLIAARVRSALNFLKIKFVMDD
jgi:hypothetical protein